MATLNDKQLLALLAAADTGVKRTLSTMITSLAKIGIRYEDLPADELFTFADYPQHTRQVEQIVQACATALEKTLSQATERAMQLSYKRAAQAVGALNLPTDVFASEYNKSVVSAFRAYRDDVRNGLNLSQRVWNYAQQNKSEFELAMSQSIEDGIAHGTSAEALARSVRHRLNRPDEMYRRYHVRKIDENGGSRKTIEWRRRTIDEDGNEHFTSTDIEAVGRGVYRSSRQNALRLAATEINMSYRYADCMQMQDNKFCRGYEIRLSNNHPITDICDELCGEYPTDFVFTGWHPRCLCAIIPIMCSLEERLDYLQLSEEEQQAWQPREGYIRNTPAAFQNFCRDNAEKLQASIESGRGSYFIRDNQALIAQLAGLKNVQPQQTQSVMPPT